MKVFLSSTYEDLKRCREEVRLALRRLRIDGLAMEDSVAGDARPVEACLRDVRECDVYVGVFAWRYGHVPDGHDASITELEYDEARRAGKTCLIFLLDEHAPWPAVYVDRGAAGERVEALRRRLAGDHVCAYFATPEELGAQCVAALARLAGAARDDAAALTLVADGLALYRQRIQQEYSRVDLDALTPPEREEYLQISLRSVFVEPYVREQVPPMELPRELWQLLQERGEVADRALPEGLTASILARVKSQYESKPLRRAFDAVAGGLARTTVVLGSPGAGKSTMARYLALMLTSGEPGARLRPVADHVPFLIELRGYARLRQRCDTFLEYLDYLGRTERRGVDQAQLDSYLRHDGRALVIFDGLDEIFAPDEREAVARQIAAFATEYPRARVVVTSRIVGYQRRTLTAAGFTHFTLQDFTEPQVDEFLRRWYELALHAQPDEAERRRARVMRAVRESPPIRELAGNPLLLTILAIIGKHQELPRERWRVYDHAASVLLEHWDVNRHLRNNNIAADHISRDDKRELLRRLAYRMQDGAGGLAGNHLHVEDLCAEFETYLRERYQQDAPTARAVATAMIGQFRERNFILSRYGAEVYGFVHRAFLEFFCAESYVGRFEKTQELTLDDLKDQVFARRWRDESWTEVLRLVVGMVAERFADVLITFLLDQRAAPAAGGRPEDRLRRVVLATQCLAEVRNPAAVAGAARTVLGEGTALLERAVGRSDPALESAIETKILSAVASVGTAWPDREAYATWYARRGRRMAWHPVSVLAARITALLLADRDEVRADLADQARHSSDARLRRAGVAGLAEGWRDHPDTLALLLHRARRDVNVYVREDTVKLLAEHWHGEPAARDALRDIADGDPKAEARTAAIRALAEWWPDEADTRAALLRCVADDPDGEVRAVALGEIADRWPDEPGTLPLVRARLAEDPHYDVRAAAVRALAALARDDGRTLAALRRHAVHDPDEDVRAAALTAVVDGWRDHPDTLPLVRARAVDDAHRTARAEAVELLLRGWIDDPRTRELILDRAGADPADQVRATALRSLAGGWPDDGQVRAALAERAERDPASAARTAAVEATATARPGDADTGAWLRRRAADDPDEDVRAAAVRQLAEAWRDDPATPGFLRERAIGDEHRTARAAAVEAAGRLGAGDPETLALLRRVAARDPDAEVRAAAVGQLADARRDAPEVRDFLRDRVTADEHHTARVAAVKAVAWTGDDPRAPALLRRVASADTHSDVRAAAATQLAEGWRDHPDTAALLRARATDDPHYVVRLDTVEAFTRTRYDDPGALDFLKAVAEADVNDEVRREAVRGVACVGDGDEDSVRFLTGFVTNPAFEQYYQLDRDEALDSIAMLAHDRPETLPLLHRVARHDRDSWARARALDNIVSGWRRHPDTLPLLLERLADGTDGFQYDRRRAVHLIAAGWRDEPGVREVVRRLACKDRTAEVRADAVRALGGQWPFHPGTLPLLADRVANDVDRVVREAAVHQHWVLTGTPPLTAPGAPGTRT